MAKNEVAKKMEQLTKEKPWMKYVIGFVVIIIIANVSATLAQDKVIAELAPLRAQMEVITARLAEIDAKTGGLLNLDEVKANVEHIQKTMENFNTRINAIVKTEEAKLEILEKDLASQKAYVEEVKTLLSK